MMLKILILIVCLAGLCQIVHEYWGISLNIAMELLFLCYYKCFLVDWRGMSHSKWYITCRHFVAVYVFVAIEQSRVVINLKMVWLVCYFIRWNHFLRFALPGWFDWRWRPSVFWSYVIKYYKSHVRDRKKLEQKANHVNH